MKSILQLSIVAMLIMLAGFTVKAQLSITNSGNDFMIDFDSTLASVNNDQFMGSGFSPSPIPGQLNSQAFIMGGFSDGSMAFGDTRTTGDFARGASSGGVGSGGCYAFEVVPGNFALGAQPTGSDWTPGTIGLKVVNNTDSIIQAITISYDIYVNNDQPRGNSLNFSHSANDVSYVMEPTMDYTSPTTSDGLGFVDTARSITITGLSIPNTAFYYFQWESNDASGSGGRDEIAIDNIVINVETVGGASCVISSIASSNISSCNDNGTPSDISDDFFTADIAVSFVDAPSSGTLDLKLAADSTTLSSVDVTMLDSASGHGFLSVEFSANGNDVDLFAVFTADSLCSFVQVSAVPGVSACPPIQVFELSMTDSCFVVNFDDPIVGAHPGQIDGSGFSSTPLVGQVNSNTFKVTGLSDGDLEFGDEGTSGDYARGSSSGGVTSGGFYAFEVGTGDHALGVQPTGSDWTPGSIVMQFKNTTGSTITDLDVTYDIYVLNNGDRANSFDFSHSADDMAYTSGITFLSPAMSDASPTWDATTQNIMLTGLSIADGATYYLRWDGADVNGSGSRDEIALDNISLNAGGTCSSCPLTITVDSVVCDANTSGTDNYTAYVSFTGGGQGSGTYTIMPSPTGDDPNTVAAGQFTLTGTEGMGITLEITSVDCSISEQISSPVCEPICPLTVNVDSVVCDASTSGTDNYTAYVSFTGGGQGAATYTITPSPTGDDPNTMATGQFTLAGTEGMDISLMITSTDCSITEDITSPVCVPCPNPGDIIITEFMANPADVSDGVGEYIEFYNRSTESYDLFGFTITDQGTNSHTIGSSVIIAPGEYVVIAKSDSLGMVVDYVYSDFDMSNGNDEILLRCPDGTLITAVFYTDGDPFGSGIATELKCLDIAGFSFTIDDFIAASDVINYDVDADTDLGSPGALGNTVGAAGPIAILLDDAPVNGGSGLVINVTICAADADSVSPCGYEETITLTQTEGPAASITSPMVMASEGCAIFEVTLPTVPICDTVKFVATEGALISDTISILVKEAIHVEGFTCSTQSWTVENVDGQQTWECDTTAGFVLCSTFGDTTTISDDWIISPALDFSAYEAISINFQTRERFNGPALELLYSEDYSGMGDPNAATWTSLSFNFDNSQNGFAYAPWTESGDVAIPSNATSVHMAFKYSASIDTSMSDAAEWQVDDVIISGCPKVTGGLVVNEVFNDQSFGGGTCFSHASFIELIATPSLDDTTATTLNLQKWMIDPSTGEPGHARIKSGCFTDIPVGALLVIYNADNVPAGIAGPDEMDANGDLVYFIPSNSACIEYTSDATFPGTTYVSGDDGSCLHANQVSALFSTLPLTVQTRSIDAVVFDELTFTPTATPPTGSSSMDCNNISDETAVLHDVTTTPGAANTAGNGIIIEAIKDEAGNGTSGMANPEAINYVNYLTSGLTPMCGEIVTPTCVDTLVLTGPMMVVDTFEAADVIETMGAVIASGDLVFDAPEIILGPNFEVPLGIEFTTLLSGCSSAGGRQANIQIIRVIDGEDEQIIDLRDREE